MFGNPFFVAFQIRLTTAKTQVEATETLFGLLSVQYCWKMVAVGRASGHYPYFREIIQKINGGKWNIGWHSSSDLKRIEKFISTMGLQQEQVILFRT